MAEDTVEIEHGPEVEVFIEGDEVNVVTVAEPGPAGASFDPAPLIEQIDGKVEQSEYDAFVEANSELIAEIESTLTNALTGKLDASEVGVSVAPLDGMGLLPEERLPASVALMSNVQALVNTTIDNLLNGASSAADTLRELEDLLGDANSAIQALIAGLAAKADTAYVDDQIADVVQQLTVAIVTEQQARANALLPKADKAYVDQLVADTLASAMQAVNDLHVTVTAETEATVLVERKRITVLENRNVVKLATKFISAHQEGGKTIMQGEFTPDANGTGVVEFDIDASGLSASWGGTSLTFCMGVLPAVPPTPREGGTVRSKITNVATNAARTPLPGVTEYSFEVIGQIDPGAILGNARNVIRKTGLTPGRTYQWEVRMGGASYYKEHIFPAGWAPTWVASIPGDESFVMVGCAGATRKVSMVSLGWSPLWKHGDTPIDMLRYYDFAVSQNVLGVTMQSQLAGAATSRYCAVVHTAAITIIDTWSLSVVGVYALGHNIMNVRADRNGLYFYVGCINNHVHRFNLATLAFDQQTDIGVASWAIVLGTSANDQFMWVSAFSTQQLLKIDVATMTVVATVQTPMPVSGVRSNINNGAVLADGRLVAYDSTIGNLFTLDVNGAATGVVDTTGSGNGGGYLALAPRDERVMFTRGARLGWAWVDTSQRINIGTMGFTGPTFGQIINTDHEGTTICIPGDNKVAHWPGGDFLIDPDVNETTAFGGMHLNVRVQGASINGG